MSQANLVQKYPTITQPIRSLRVPNYLVKDEIDGVKFYYQGYQEVLDKTKQKEEIMGCSGLQSSIVEYIFTILILAGIQKKYRIFTNEAGNTLARKTNLQFDLAIYDKNLLTGAAVTRRYVRGIAPTIVFEIDLDVELKGTGVDSLEQFVQLKTQKLLDYGTQKVFWIFTKSKKVFIADAENQRIESWDLPIEILDGIYFNIEQHLKSENIDPDAV